MNVNHIGKLPAASLAVAAAIALSACAPYRALELSPQPAHTLANRQERRGLVVAATGFLDRDAVRRYFGESIWDAGYFPVVLHFENRGTGIFELQRSQIEIRRQLSRGEETGNEETLSPVRYREVAEQSRESTAKAYLLTPFLVVPAILVHRQIEERNFERTKDLSSKALPAYYRFETTAAPLRGAAFFRRPRGIPLHEALEGAEIRIDVKVEGSRLPDPRGEQQPGSARTDQQARLGESITFILPLARVEE